MNVKKGEDAEIVRLHDEERQSFREIGRLIGISHVAVRKRYVNALSRLNNKETFPLAPVQEITSRAIQKGNC